jgi:glutamate N-acetyltransferase/amino-acid N-acetyltransferase
MIHPNLATMLCFLTTDAVVELDFLKSALRRAVDISFNMVSVDGDTSPSDTVLLMANGLAKNKLIVSGSQQADIFQQALNQICVYLAKAIARDGEGATRLIEVTVTGALNIADARLAARTIVSSSLVKTAVHGADPNWGRIIVAAGRSGAEVVPSKLNLSIGDVLVLKGGTPLSYDEASVIEVFKRKEVPITLNLNLGTASATAWGCDLSKKYVTINSQYMT